MRSRARSPSAWLAAGLCCAVSTSAVAHADDSPVVQPTRSADGSEPVQDPTVPAPEPTSAPTTTVLEPHSARAPQRFDDERAPAHANRQRGGGYAGWLLAGYLVLPALAVTLALVSPEVEAEAVFFGVTAAVLVPPTIHLIHGEGGLAVQTLLGWPGVTLGCGLLGVFAGAGIGALTGRGDDEEWGVLPDALAGALIGGVLGAAAWATYDVAQAFSGSRRSSSSARSRATLRFALAPHPQGGVVGALSGGF